MIAKKNLQHIAPIKGPDNIVALIPEDSFGVEDYGFVKDVKLILEGSEIKIVKEPAEIGDEQNILFISGHNDEQLFDYLHHLGQLGVLKGKVVFLNTCYASSNPDKLHDLITEYGALGFLHHTDKIRPIAIEKTLEQIVAILKERKEHGTAIHPTDLLQQAVERALQNSDHSKQLRQEIEKLSRGVMQISEVYSKPSKIKYVRNVYG